MEHIVQFAIGIDDAAIQQRVEDNAYNDILKILLDDAKRDLPKTYGTVNWRFLIEETLENFIERNREEIINCAAKELCESFKRTKAFKEKMSDTMEECFR